MTREGADYLVLVVLSMLFVIATTRGNRAASHPQVDSVPEPR
ncbi:hypothetical protein [Alicyclobacillus shizuokensis]|nr:hypothetical protein [Alicyclobacillus shizuokensis]